MVSIENENRTVSIAQLLHTLVSIDSRILKIEESIKEASLLITESKLRAATAAQTLDLLEKNTRAARHKVVTSEADIKFMRAKEDEKRNNLDSIATQKEYRSACREVETLKKQNIAAEEALIIHWQEAEALEKNLVFEQTNSVKRQEELAQIILKNTELLVQLKQEHQILLKEKTQKSTLIPSEWIDRYNKMQISVPDPIVATTQGCCGACFYAIVPQEYARIKKGEVLLCRSCYRFLYFDTEKESQTTKQ